jgi:hypothetical protein
VIKELKIKINQTESLLKRRFLHDACHGCVQFVGDVLRCACDRKQTNLKVAQEAVIYTGFQVVIDILMTPSFAHG